MRPAVVRLVLCAALFLLWIGYLGYLVATRPRTPEGTPLVLSKPQIHAAEVVVRADVPAPPGKDFVEVTVVEVLKGGDGGLNEGTKLQVAGLESSHPVARSAAAPPSDWTKAGEYILPLRKLRTQQDHYEVMPIPASPGFNPGGSVQRIYPATKEALAQYEAIEKGKR